MCMFTLAAIQLAGEPNPCGTWPVSAASAIFPAPHTSAAKAASQSAEATISCAHRTNPPSSSRLGYQPHLFTRRTAEKLRAALVEFGYAPTDTWSLRA